MKTIDYIKRKIAIRRTGGRLLKFYIGGNAPKFTSLYDTTHSLIRDNLNKRGIDKDTAELAALKGAYDAVTNPFAKKVTMSQLVLDAQNLAAQNTPVRDEDIYKYALKNAETGIPEADLAYAAQSVFRRQGDPIQPTRSRAILIGRN